MVQAKHKAKFRIGINAGAQELLGIVLCVAVFFVLPILILDSQKVQNSAAASETYTKQAITEAQGAERVAGLETLRTTVDSKYFVVPLLNFRFDTTLSETPTIVFLFGTVLLTGGMVFALSMFIDARRFKEPSPKK